jgi:hypothetical protein
MAEPVNESGSQSVGFRRKRDGELWHFCSNCSNWPRVSYIEQWQKPSNGEICSECDNGFGREVARPIFCLSPRAGKPLSA